MVVIVSLLLLKTFRQRYNRQNKVLVGMASSAYTVYIIHPVILVLRSYFLLSMPLHPLLKFGLLVILGTLTSFAIASVVKRIPGARRIL